MANTNTAEQLLCIRCLLFTSYCTCCNGPRVQRHPSECACSMCDLGRGEYDDHSNDEENDQ